ncbi:MAG TPA: phenylacetate--CoA ligase family protein [Actinomycetota bacterium]|nr:phenylacetate--CoA ligase family protein [Actinomycetota bacterium]
MDTSTREAPMIGTADTPSATPLHTALQCHRPLAAPAPPPAVPLTRLPVLAAARAIRGAGLRHGTAFRILAQHPCGLPDCLSPAAAMRAAALAYDWVPAYRDFVRTAGAGRARHIGDLPETDKASYVDAYPLAARCVGGAIPARGVAIDESSGSSGRPYTWVRSQRELADVHRSLSRLAAHLYGPDLVTLNGFSMGAWATGTNVTAALARNGLVKSPGPDVDKILSVFGELGARRRYLVAGYPPFLKRLIDEAEAAGFDWAAYEVYGVVGGEGMSEGQRTYLEARFSRVYSAYGASDLDIGVAAELPLSVWIRRRACEDPALARALFGTAGRLPMLFQYNPLDYYAEANAAGELVITVNRPAMLSPRIRYNIHDAGGTLGFAQVIGICRDFGLDPLRASAAESGIAPFRLPFLFVRGRSDSTLSYMGANIYPEDVETALFTGSAEAARLGTFCLELLELPGAEVRPCVHVEVRRGSLPYPALERRLAGAVRQRLMAASRDFAAAVAEDPATGDVAIRLHAPGEGPFAGNAGRIKQRYIVR